MTQGDRMNTAIIEANGIQIPLELVARSFDLPVETALAEMRAGRITGVVEKGGGTDEGRFRMTFFHGTRRARIVVTETGELVQRSCVDFGTAPVPR